MGILEAENRLQDRSFPTRGRIKNSRKKRETLMHDASCSESERVLAPLLAPFPFNGAPSSGSFASGPFPGFTTFGPRTPESLPLAATTTSPGFSRGVLLILLILTPALFQTYAPSHQQHKRTTRRLVTCREARAN